MMKDESVKHEAKISWIDQKNKLSAKFSTLTDKDLNFDESKREDMFKHLQSKLNQSRAALNEVTQTV